MIIILFLVHLKIWHPDEILKKKKSSTEKVPVSMIIENQTAEILENDY